MASSLNLTNPVTQNNGNTLQFQSTKTNDNHIFQFPPLNLLLNTSSTETNNAAASAAINSSSLAMLQFGILNSPNGLVHSPFFNMPLNGSSSQTTKCLSAANLNLLAFNSFHNGHSSVHNLSNLNRSPDPDTDQLNTPRIF